jgi:hypothetical protein
MSCRRSWFGALVLLLALVANPGTALAQPGASVAPVYPVQAYPPAPAAQGAPGGDDSSSSLFSCCDLTPCCPACCDLIGNVPTFFSGFVARPRMACFNIPGTPGTPPVPHVLSLTALNLDQANIGPGGTPPATVSFNNNPSSFTGPGGPYNVFSASTGARIGTTSNYNMVENTELTGLVRAKFPTATFRDGLGTLGIFGAASGDVVFDYLFTTGQFIPGTPGQMICVNLPDPSGGGLVGRNNFFDNGSPIPQDRVYFTYNHIGNYTGLGNGFDINRYVVGAEKAFLNGLFSVECRLPFAGTANSDQVAGQNLSVDQVQLGNLGLAGKIALYRTASFLVSAGLGVSLPTASDSRMFLNGKPVIEIQNHAVLLQPMLGAVWAPSSSLYTQVGLQFDIDPSGNPVQVLSTTNNLYRAGVLRDQTYAFLTAAAGYWVYQSNDSWLSRVALQGELHYDSSFGSQNTVQDANVNISYLNSRVNALSITGGVVCQMGNLANLAVGLTFPIGGERLSDWNLAAQVNLRFGGVVRTDSDNWDED